MVNKYLCWAFFISLLLMMVAIVRQSYDPLTELSVLGTWVLGVWILISIAQKEAYGVCEERKEDGLSDEGAVLPAGVRSVQLHGSPTGERCIHVSGEGDSAGTAAQRGGAVAKLRGLCNHDAQGEADH